MLHCLRKTPRTANFRLPALAIGVFGVLAASTAAAADANQGKPNIVFILCDDLGYGDARCNNPECKIATPHIDRLAAAGMRFTDAHSSSAVCTPSRYSILTGRYNWRSRLQVHVLGGFSERLIEPDRLTVAELLREHGYHTACIGKWHLGMHWARKPDTAPFPDSPGPNGQGWNADFTQPITNGPNQVGFAYSFVLSASLDMPPYTFIENDRLTAIPTVDKTFPITSGKQQPRTRLGPAAADFEAVDALPTLTAKAVQYIADQASTARAGKPFFLYFPLTAPHTPHVPTPEWQGRSGINAYADFVMETDDCIGQVLNALAQNGLADNTLVILTSDNGCSPRADLDELAAKGHHPSYVFRGTKADIWDGGHRVPYIVRWPGKVAPGTVCQQLVGQLDFMATCADIVGAKLPDSAGEDSVSLLPTYLSKAAQPPRDALVHHSISGKFAIRQGDWKLELCPGSGGWSAPRDPAAKKQHLPDVQLYDLRQDIGEKQNLQAARPEVVKRLTALLEKYVADGRSTPGAPQKNNADIDIWKKQ